MATVTRTFAFLADAEGFVASPAASISLVYSSTVGNPAGSLEAGTGAKSISGTSWWEWAGTWADLGVPAGSVVTSVRLTGASTRCSTRSSHATTTTLGPYELRDSAAALIGTLWTGRAATSQEAGWTVTPAQTAVAVPSHAETTSVRIRLADTIATGGGGGTANVKMHDDQVTVEVTYDAAPAGPANGTALSNTAEGVGTAGTAVTTANSASGGNAFSTVYSAEGSSVTVGATGGQGSAASYRLAQPTAATATGSANVRWNPAVSSIGTDVYGSVDLNLAAQPSAVVSILDARLASPSTRRFRIDYNPTDGKLRITNSAGSTMATAATVLPLNTWVTVQWRFLANTSIEMRVYHDPASATVTDTATWTAAVGADLDSFWYGNVVSQSSFDYQLDNLSAGQSTWPSRTLVGASPVVTSTTALGVGVALSSTSAEVGVSTSTVGLGVAVTSTSAEVGVSVTSVGYGFALTSAAETAAAAGASTTTIGVGVALSSASAEVGVSATAVAYGVALASQAAEVGVSTTAVALSVGLTSTSAEVGVSTTAVGYGLALTAAAAQVVAGASTTTVGVGYALTSPSSAVVSSTTTLGAAVGLSSVSVEVGVSTTALTVGYAVTSTTDAVAVSSTTTVGVGFDLSSTAYAVVEATTLLAYAVALRSEVLPEYTFTPTPPERTLTVAREDRTVRVPAESRVLRVPAETRATTTVGESRVLLVPADNRELVPSR